MQKCYSQLINWSAAVYVLEEKKENENEIRPHPPRSTREYVLFSSPPDIVVVAKLNNPLDCPASFSARTFNWYQVAGRKSCTISFSLDTLLDTRSHLSDVNGLYIMEN